MIRKLLFCVLAARALGAALLDGSEYDLTFGLVRRDIRAPLEDSVLARRQPLAQGLWKRDFDEELAILRRGPPGPPKGSPPRPARQPRPAGSGTLAQPERMAAAARDRSPGPIRPPASPRASGMSDSEYSSGSERSRPGSPGPGVPRPGIPSLGGPVPSLNIPPRRQERSGSPTPGIPIPNAPRGPRDGRSGPRAGSPVRQVGSPGSGPNLEATHSTLSSFDPFGPRLSQQRGRLMGGSSEGGGQSRSRSSSLDPSIPDAKAHAHTSGPSVIHMNNRPHNVAPGEVAHTTNSGRRVTDIHVGNSAVNSQSTLHATGKNAFAHIENAGGDQTGILQAFGPHGVETKIVGAGEDASVRAHAALGQTAAVKAKTYGLGISGVTADNEGGNPP